MKKKFKLESPEEVFIMFPKRVEDKCLFLKDCYIKSFGRSGYLVVEQYYSWDGCSPKFTVFGKVFGTPDGKIVKGLPKTYYASLVHDVLYQNLENKNNPFNRKEIDLLFLYLLRVNDFHAAGLYYLGVRWFGGIYHKLNKRKK